MSNSIDQEREAFEAGLHVQSRRRNEVGDYVLPSIQDRWEGWQARASVQPAGGAVPEGWKLVPIKPTAEMKAVCRVAGKTQVWADMIAASPAAPHPVSGEQNPRPTGLSRGWNLTRQVDGFVIGHSSEEPSEKSKAQAIHDGYIYVPFLVGATPPAAQDVAVLVEAAAEMFDMLEWRAGDTGDLLLSNDQRDQWSALIAAHRAQQGEQP